jgi:hypothetical protein
VRRDLSVAEAIQTAPAEAVPLGDRPTPAWHGSRGWSRAPGRILTGASIFAVAAAGFFVVWGLNGSGLEELSLANARPALSWLHLARVTNPSSNAGVETPTEKRARNSAPRFMRATSRQRQQHRQPCSSPSVIDPRLLIASTLAPHRQRLFFLCNTKLGKASSARAAAEG